MADKVKFVPDGKPVGKFDRFIDTSGATIQFVPNGGTTTCPLVSGVVVKAGPITVDLVKTDQDGPMAATFISEDEAIIVPHTAATVTGSAPVFIWKFEWTDVPPLGCNGLLRLEEILDAGMGAVTQLTVHVIADLDLEPCPPVFDHDRLRPTADEPDEWIA